MRPLQSDSANGPALTFEHHGDSSDWVVALFFSVRLVSIFVGVAGIVQSNWLWVLIGSVTGIASYVWGEHFPSRPWVERVVIGDGWVRIYKQTGRREMVLFEAPYNEFREVLVEEHTEVDATAEIGWKVPNVFLVHYSRRLAVFDGTSEWYGDETDSPTLNTRDYETIQRISKEMRIPAKFGRWRAPESNHLIV